MRCSICNSKCEINGQAPLETLDEHVTNTKPCMKDKYVCTNPNCIGHASDLCWNFMGEAYFNYRDRDKLVFIDGMSAAMGTDARQWEAESNRDDTRELFTFPCWPRKGWRLRVCYAKTADKDGNILKKKRYFEWITNENTLHISGWKMIKHCLGQLSRTKSWSRKKYLEELQENIKRMEWPRAEWWRKVVGRYS